MRTNILQVRKTLLALFAMLMPLVASAHDFEVGGIYYNITSESDKKVAVTYKRDSYNSYSNEYSGSITVPATVTYNGVEYSVTSIVGDAFYNCSGLTSITIPESVTSIGGEAFRGCSSLTTINIPEGVTSIGNGAFSYCSNLTAITIPESVTSIGGSAFRDCSSLTAITIPESVTNIGSEAFSYCISLTDITIPEGVTSIGEYAFSDCSSLTAINIPEGVTSIGNGAFSYCSSLTTITIPEGVTKIGYQAFYGCSSLTTINIPESSQLTSIDYYAFYDCSSLTAITIPEGVTSIGEWAFSGCGRLKWVINYSDLDIRKGNSSNGYVAYNADVAINLDEFIGDYAFKTKDGVHYLTGYIGDATELTLPADYQGKTYQIGGRAFYDCSSLTAITIPEDVTSIGEWAFSHCSSLTTINIPEGVTSIGNYTFYRCSSLTAITIPEGVTSIGNSAFCGCSSLKELTLGEELKKIGAEAFVGCTALEKVTIYATQPPSIEGKGNAFFSDATYENATLYVPQGCIDKYQVMTGWSNFYTIEESGDNAIENARASRIKVQGHHGTLRITGATEGDDISVYTIDGMLVAQESAEGSETELTLPTGQVYIVTVADKEVKIGL